MDSDSQLRQGFYPALRQTRRASLRTAAEKPSRRIEHRRVPANTRSTFHRSRSDFLKADCELHSRERRARWLLLSRVSRAALFSKQASLDRASPTEANS